MAKIKATAVLGLSFLFLTACSSSNYNADEVPDISPENLYKIARNGMVTGDYDYAVRYLEALDSRYPFGELSNQVQLDLIHSYYKSRKSELALAQINRYIRLNPTDPHLDYVYYMKGLTELQMRSDMIQDYLGLDRSQKDPTMYRQAFRTFKVLVTQYPDSLYAADAQKRMIFIRNELAKREKAIADYYFEREAYVAAIRACQRIVYSYRETDQLKGALELMAESYDRLSLPEAAANTRSVLRTSFLNKPIATADAAADDGSWYDFLFFWE